MQNIFSKNQIRKLGGELRNNGTNISEDLLLKLQDYRTSHKDSLANVFSALYSTSTNIRPDAIVTYRIKRIESILGKLERYPEMDFDRMWDIAGCRCIVPTKIHLDKIQKRIEKNLYVRKINDYHSIPQESGYRSIHLYVSCKQDDNKIIEIQLRTIDDHNWATLVEIVDFLYDKKIKEGENDRDLRRFHFLLSKKNELTFAEKKEVLDIVDKFDIYNKLSSVFVKNYLNIRRQWLDINRGIKGSFYIIEAKKDEPPLIKSYTNFTEAEDEYFKRFKTKSESNTVLAFLPNANYERIGKAYSNYVLTMHTFLDDCCKLLEDLIHNSIERRNIFSFKKYYSLYVKTMSAHIKDIEEEWKSISELLQVRKNSKEIKYWQIDFKKRYAKRGNEINRLNSKWGRDYPKSGLYRILFNFVSSHVSAKYGTKPNSN